ncbi:MULTISPECIES: immunity 52 family protein [Burkholderia]|nr:MULTISPECIES: immunity 52 family protein [Burkholderia]
MACDERIKGAHKTVGPRRLFQRIRLDASHHRTTERSRAGHPSNTIDVVLPNASDDGASLSCHVEDKSLPDTSILRIKGERWNAYTAISGIGSKMVAVFGSALAEVSVDEYAVKQVFDDKPGLGWMLYLPKILTPQQTPEARVLIPVPEKGKQTGTIIVSVTDAPFSVDNPEHVAIANRIESRLVDQDLLPAYVDI